MIDLVEHLQTKYVFIDTEALRRARFDWTGRILSKLVELAKQGHLQLLTTDVVIGEVRSQLREILSDAVASIRKHETVLTQIGAVEALTYITNADTTIDALNRAFETFLKDTKSINVPLSADLGALFDDYFARRPPFSNKKKSEFPDAVTIASLRAWCAKHKASAYVVSGDSDLQECCSPSGPLFYAASVSDIISQATVSKELHEALEKALSEDHRLIDELADQINSMGLVGRQGITGRITGVDEINIHYVNVVTQAGKQFTCEIEFEAEVNLDLTVEYYDLYSPPYLYEMRRSLSHVFQAEVIAVFEQATCEVIDVESVGVYGNALELNSRQITEILS
jgi:hypothetical protein